VTAQRYIDQILRVHVLPVVQGQRNLVLQQDNARPHTARVTQDFLQQHNIEILPWPALSPDLNPIEHFWDNLQRELNRVQPRPITAVQLEGAVIQAWNNIPRAAIRRLLHSMPRRCRAVINANGGHTPY
jgi:transposase